MHRANIVEGRRAQVALAHGQAVYFGEFAQHTLGHADLDQLPRVNLAVVVVFGICIPIHAALWAGRVAAGDPIARAIADIERGRGIGGGNLGVVEINADLVVVGLGEQVARVVRVQHQADPRCFFQPIWG